MVLYLIRFAELGLKSERVRRRFLQSFLKDIERRLTSAGVDHIIERERGRIFIDSSRPRETVEVLKRIPGIQSFSPVEGCSSDWDSLMEKLREIGSRTIKPGMSYGLKVRRSGNSEYTSQDVAVEGGGAVVSHLKEGENRVDLGNPDILRGEMAALSRKAYKVLWMHPLAGDPSLQPSCKGMRAALRYVDYLLPAWNLESLRRVTRLLSRMIL